MTTLHYEHCFLNWDWALVSVMRHLFCIYSLHGHLQLIVRIISPPISVLFPLVNHDSDKDDSKLPVDDIAFNINLVSSDYFRNVPSNLTLLVRLPLSDCVVGVRHTRYVDA